MMHLTFLFIVCALLLPSLLLASSFTKQKILSLRKFRLSYNKKAHVCENKLYGSVSMFIKGNTEFYILFYTTVEVIHADDCSSPLTVFE